MALIELKEENYDENLEILKNFYINVFQKNEEYRECPKFRVKSFS
jgi:hypothetical protein